MKLIIIYMLYIHFIADFVLQSDRMAINKSKSWKVLLEHSLVYYGTLATGLFLYTMEIPPLLFSINFVSHFIIDAITSRINVKLWERNERHWFFVTIGFDQFLHTTILLLTTI